MGNIYSFFRRNIINEGDVYNVKDLFGGLIKEEGNQITIDDPEFYDMETKTLKLGNLCARDINRGVTPNVNMGGQLYSVYCALTQLSNTLEPSLVQKLHYNIDKIYNFLRRNLSYDNRVKFHRLMKVILEYENPANTMNIIVDFIEGGNSVDEITYSLDRFRKEGGGVDENSIDEFLRKIKSTAYQEYEKSFHGEHFEKYQTGLSLKYKTKEENITLFKRIISVKNNESTLEETINVLYNTIINNYKPEEMVKADVKCKKDLKDVNGNTIIEDGELVEIKKIDYAADSYLSEFMALYKSSKLPEIAYEPEFKQIYNQIIDGLYEKFESNGNILEDIKNNFAGIIYDDKIFIGKDDIELYWSNKGRGSCLKDHRLSIRYRIKNPNPTAYVYEGGDVLKNKEISITLSSDKEICPKTSAKNVVESYNLNETTQVLVEGRVEDARKKYPDVNNELFNYYVDNDPSGNQKYLDWLLKRTPERLINKVYTTTRYILEKLKLFHDKNQMFKIKDINQYKGFNDLITAVRDVEEKLVRKQIKQQAKQQKDVIYKDDRWLVVSPHTWEASCYYGAGTKWCITSTDDTAYWNRYSKNSTFFFIIDKTKTQEDNLYKVAYRIIGRKGKYELWNAIDHEITNKEVGREWFDALPEKLKEDSQNYHQEVFLKKIESNPILEDPRAQALNNLLNDDIIEEVGGDYYGMPIYLVDEEYYVVGNEIEMNDAVKETFDDYTDLDLIEYYDPNGNYIEFDDEEDFINGEVEALITDSTDEEILEQYGILDEYNGIIEKIGELENELSSFNGTEEEKEQLSGDIDYYNSLASDLIESSKEGLEKYHRREWEECLSDGVVECLVNYHGWFRNVTQLFKNMGYSVSLNRTDLIEKLTYETDYDVVSHGYGIDEERDNDGNYWFIFQIDY